MNTRLCTDGNLTSNTQGRWTPNRNSYCYTIYSSILNVLYPLFRLQRRFRFCKLSDSDMGVTIPLFCSFVFLRGWVGPFFFFFFFPVSMFFLWRHKGIPRTTFFSDWTLLLWWLDMKCTWIIGVNKRTYHVLRFYILFTILYHYLTIRHYVYFCYYPSCFITQNPYIKVPP